MLQTGDYACNQAIVYIQTNPPNITRRYSSSKQLGVE